MLLSSLMSLQATNVARSCFFLLLIRKSIAVGNLNVKGKLQRKRDRDPLFFLKKKLSLYMESSDNHSACKCCTNAERKAFNCLRSLYIHLAELRVHGSYDVYLQESVRQSIFADRLCCAFLENKNINGSQFVLHLTALLIYFFFIVTCRDKMGGNKVKVHTKALKQLLLALRNRMG